MFFKKLKVPLTNETKLVDAVQLWEVRWRSRYGDYSGNTQPEMETFTSEEEATEYRDALENAFKLIRHSSGNDVYIKKAK